MKVSIKKLKVHKYRIQRIHLMKNLLLIEEAPVEEPSTEKLDETFVRNLKTRSKIDFKRTIRTRNS
jgi:hypothetical protein